MIQNNNIKEENDEDNKNLQEKFRNFFKETKQTGRKRIVKWSYFELIQAAFFENCKESIDIKKSQYVFNSLKSRIADNHNVVSYNNMYENFDKLRILLLDERQNFCFDFLRPRQLEDFNNDSQIENLKLSHKYFMNNNKFDRIDEVLLINFNKKFKRFLS